MCCSVTRFIGQTSSNRYQPATGPIWLDNVQCNGSETFIGDCAHNGWGSHDCSHKEDVSITCINPSLTPPTPGNTDTRFPCTSILFCSALQCSSWISSATSIAQHLSRFRSFIWRKLYAMVHSESSNVKAKLLQRVTNVRGLHQFTHTAYLIIRKCGLRK